MNCTVVVPTYNERSNIEALVSRLLALGPLVKVLVVDDNSPDGTGQIVEALAQREPRIRVIHRPGKAGLGGAYVQGFQFALAEGCDYVTQMDADLSHQPEKILTFLEAARRTDADLVVGTRYAHGGGVVNWPLARRLLSRMGNLYARLLLGRAISDYTSGFALIRADSLRRIPYPTFGATGFAFLLELKWAFLQRGMRIVEVPITFVERAHGDSKLSLGIIAEALAVVWRMRRAKMPTPATAAAPAPVPEPPGAAAERHSPTVRR